MRSATCAIGLALIALTLGPPRAIAEDTAPSSYRAVIDRVDLEPAAIGGLRLRVALSALALQGQILDLSDRKTLRLLVGGTKLEAPYALGHYAASNADTAIAVVVQANLAYAEALPSILATLDDTVLSTLGERTQLAVLGYGDATGTAKLVSLKAGRARLAELTQDNSAGEPALLDTLDRALLLLKKARTQPAGRPLRKLVIVIGDGHDRSGDRDRVTGLGKRADREGVRIHTLGFAPSKILRPLLTLGELSKRSLGTFRWVRSAGAESWTPAFAQLRDEINKQYALTYFVPSDADLAGKKLKVVMVGRTEATSNELRIPEASCGGDPCAGYCVNTTCAIPRAGSGRSAIGWLVLVLGGAVAAVVVIGAIGYLLQRRQARATGQPGMPGMAGTPGTPGMPGHAGQPGHPALPGYPAAPGQPAMPGYPAPPGQPGQPGQPGYPAMPGQVGAAPLPRKPGLFGTRGKKPPPVAPAAATAPAPVAGPALLVMSGPRTGQRLALHNGFTIGKAPGSDLVLDDGYASTQHAQVGVDPRGTCRLYDRNSTNGTFVNGVRVNEVVLDHGMNVRIGSTELRFLAQ
jgi:hypothetical protein